MTASKYTTFAGLLIALFTFPCTATAQVSGGADLMSRYVFRGIDFGESMSAQPYLEYSNSGFTIGTWASYAFESADANEHDLYISYANGPVEVGVTDYYFPTPSPRGNPGAQFFNFGDDSGHVIEPYIAFGTDNFPLSLAAYINAVSSEVNGDPDDSIYLEAGYSTMVEDVSLDLAAGFVPQESIWYGTTAPTFINLSLTASKSVDITDDFALPLMVQYVLNPTPDAERTFLVFGTGLSF